MPFPLTYRSKIEFPLHSDPDITAEQYYKDASYKISKSFVFDADMIITAADGKLVVTYTVKFKKLLIISGVVVLILVGMYFISWALGQPVTLRRHAVRDPLALKNIGADVGLAWLWLFGFTYTWVATQFRSFLKDTWRRLILPPNAEITPPIDQKP